MNRIYFVALVTLLSLGLAASVPYAPSSTGKSQFMTFNSFDLIGVPVENSQGDFLGLVNWVMIDSQGQAFAVVNHGDFGPYGPGGINTPVPVAALRISQTKAGKENIVLNRDVEHWDLAPFLDLTLDFAPSLDLTETNDPQYEANIDRYFGLQPYWTEVGGCSK
jgi:hypothetical protein